MSDTIVESTIGHMLKDFVVQTLVFERDEARALAREWLWAEANDKSWRRNGVPAREDEDRAENRNAFIAEMQEKHPWLKEGGHE